MKITVLKPVDMRSNSKFSKVFFEDRNNVGTYIFLVYSEDHNSRSRPRPATSILSIEITRHTLRNVRRQHASDAALH